MRNFCAAPWHLCHWEGGSPRVRLTSSDRNIHIKTIRACVCVPQDINCASENWSMCQSSQNIYSYMEYLLVYWWKWIGKSLDAYSYENYSILQRIQGAVLCAIVDVQFRIGNSQKKTIRKEMQGGTLQHFSGALNLLVGPTWWISGKKMIPILQNLVPSRKIDIWLVCLFDFLN